MIEFPDSWPEDWPLSACGFADKMEHEISRLRSLIDEHNRKVKVDCLKHSSSEPLDCALMDMCNDCPRYYLIPTGEDNG